MGIHMERHTVGSYEEARGHMEEHLADAGYAMAELEDAHAKLTAAVAACNPLESLEETRMMGRNDPTAAPLWLPEALAFLVTRTGFTVSYPETIDDDGRVIGHTQYNMLDIPGTQVTIPLPGEVMIVRDLSLSSKCRMLCHELVHVIRGPDQPTGDEETDQIVHELRECVAESAAALVMGILKAGLAEYSTYLLSILSMTEPSTPFGDASIMEGIRPHSVLMAASILCGLQVWQDMQAREITAGLEPGQ